MIVIIGLVILVAAVIGVITDSLGSGAPLAWVHRRNRGATPGPGRPSRTGAGAAETKDPEHSYQGASS
jgi:hypothetical protein